MKYSQQIETLRESTDEHPLLSYTVIATVDSSVEVPEHIMGEILAGTYFENQMPASPTIEKILRRAIAATVKELAISQGKQNARQVFFDEARAAEGKSLIREIKSGDKTLLLFGFVAETVKDYGLIYLTGCRVYCVINSELTGNPLLDIQQLIVTRDRDGAAANQQDLPLTNVLQKWVDHYATHFKSSEINRMLKTTLESMTPTSLSKRGGVYSVPYRHDNAAFMSNREKLGELKGIVQAIGQYVTAQSKGEDEESVSDVRAIPVFDEQFSRHELEVSTRDALLQEVKTLQAEFERFTARRKDDDPTRIPVIHEDAMKDRLKRYEEAEKKLRLYQSLLTVEAGDITTTLEELSQGATQMLQVYQQHKQEESASKRQKKAATV